MRKSDRKGTITIAAFLIIFVFQVLSLVSYWFVGSKLVATFVLIFICFYVKALRNPAWPFSRGFIEEER